MSRYMLAALAGARGLATFAGALIELTEPQVALGNERPHAARLGEGQLSLLNYVRQYS